MASVDPDKDLRSFALQPAPRNARDPIRCRISRDARGPNRSRYPTYFLHLERDDRRTFLLAARKRKRSSTSNYLVSCDSADLSRRSSGYVGKLRSNFIGTAFTVFDAGTSAERLELAAITYETNVLGFGGPRKMTVVLPTVGPEGFRSELRPSTEPDGALVEKLRRRDMAGLLELHTKIPVWNEDTRQHVLNFQGRVKRTSVKNFQLVHESDLDNIVMQFGRISEDTFTMDFAYPMCPLQAFGIALSSFDNKLACE